MKFYKIYVRKPGVTHVFGGIQFRSPRTITLGEDEAKAFINYLEANGNVSPFDFQVFEDVPDPNVSNPKPEMSKEVDNNTDDLNFNMTINN